MNDSNTNTSWLKVTFCAIDFIRCHIVPIKQNFTLVGDSVQSAVGKFGCHTVWEIYGSSFDSDDGSTVPIVVGTSSIFFRVANSNTQSNFKVGQWIMVDSFRKKTVVVDTNHKTF